MSNSDRSDEFELEPESDMDFGMDEGLVESSLAQSISNILANFVLPDVNGDVDIRNFEDTTEIGGIIFTAGEEANPFGSGTGGYAPFLSLRDSNQNPSNSDGVATGFNVDSASDSSLNDLIFGNSRTNAVQLSNLVINVIDGVEYFQIRLDLNEPDSGTDSQLSLNQFTLYFGDSVYSSVTDLDNALLSGDATQVYDLDDFGLNGLTLLLNDNFSGSGTDDYQILIPVALFTDSGADLDNDYFYLEVEAGSADPLSEFAMEGGFFEFNVEDAGSVTGVKFLDANGNGILDDGEGAPADSFVIYVDENNNGVLDFTDDGDGILEFNGDDIILERYTETDIDGNYSFTGLVEGDHVIREFLPAGSLYEVTTGDFETVTVIANQNVEVDDWEFFAESFHVNRQSCYNCGRR